MAERERVDEAVCRGPCQEERQRQRIEERRLLMVEKRVPRVLAVEPEGRDAARRRPAPPARPGCARRRCRCGRRSVRPGRRSRGLPPEERRGGWQRLRSRGGRSHLERCLRGLLGRVSFRAPSSRAYRLRRGPWPVPAPGLHSAAHGPAPPDPRELLGRSGPPPRRRVPVLLRRRGGPRDGSAPFSTRASGCSST